MTDPTPLSPAAQAVMVAVTQRLYCLNPQDVPAAADELACVIATGLCAAVDRVVPSDPCGNSCCIAEQEQIRADILAIAAELDPTTETTND